MSKTHYRRVFKSDHLGSADLEEMKEEGKSLILTIKEVRQEYGTKVAGKKIDANIAYFTDSNIKPLVLNSTNSKIVKSFAGGSPFVEDWNNIMVELYIDHNVNFKGSKVDGLRINPVQPKPKAKPLFTKEKFAAAKGKNATVESISNHYTITPEIAKEYESWKAE